MIDLGLMFGGAPAEHEVSIASASSLAGALDRDRYNVTPIGVTRAGAWVVPLDLDVALGAPPGPAGAAGGAPRDKGRRRASSAAAGLPQVDYLVLRAAGYDEDAAVARV